MDQSDAAYLRKAAAFSGAWFFRLQLTMYAAKNLLRSLEKLT